MAQTGRKDIFGVLLLMKKVVIEMWIGRDKEVCSGRRIGNLKEGNSCAWNGTKARTGIIREW